MIDFDIVITRIHHPEPRQADIFVNRFLHHRVRVMIHGIDYVSNQPGFARGGGDKCQVGPKQRAGTKLDDSARRQQPGADDAGRAEGNPLVQSLANQFVAPARGTTQQRLPAHNLFVAVAHEFESTFRRNWPVCDCLLRATSSGVPSATIRPPPAPPSGPRSMTQSASAIKSRLCSMTMTEWPASTSRCNISTSRRTSAMCRPMVGSSRTKRLRLMARPSLRPSLHPMGRGWTSGRV